jgi:hypothetical protein
MSEYYWYHIQRSAMYHDGDVNMINIIDRTPRKAA